MNIHRAIADLKTIQNQLRRTRSTVGFRSAAVGFSSSIVMVGAVLDTYWANESEFGVAGWLVVWLTVAVLSFALAIIEMVYRGIVSGRGSTWEMHFELVAAVTPSLAVGAFLTWAIVSEDYGREHSDGFLLTSLPWIWAMLYGLGLLNCRFRLPPLSKCVGAYLVFAGGIGLIAGEAVGVSRPLAMILTFGAAQLCLALILYRYTETSDD